MSMPDVEAGETTPLVGSSNEPPPLQDMKAESLKERTVMAVGGASFLLSLLTLIFQSSLNPLVWVSGFLGVIIGPAAAFQQHKLTQVEALAQTNERLSAEVDQLTAENVRLQASVQQMEESVLNLQAMEQTLSTLNQVQGVAVDELEQQLQESKDILARMKQNSQGGVLQNLISVLQHADNEGDMRLDDEDIADLIRRLEGLHNVDIDDEKLKKVIVDNGRSVEAIMQLAKQVLQAENLEETGIFRFMDEEK